MSILDFIFPDQAQAMHLREIAENSRGLRRSEGATVDNKMKIDGQVRRIQKLENDMALMAMLNVILIKKYVIDTGKSLEKLKAELEEVDKSDGIQDGGFDVGELRRMLGVPLMDSSFKTGVRVCKDCGRNILTKQDSCLYCGGEIS